MTIGVPFFPKAEPWTVHVLDLVNPAIARISRDVAMLDMILCSPQRDVRYDRQIRAVVEHLEDALGVLLTTFIQAQTNAPPEDPRRG